MKKIHINRSFIILLILVILIIAMIPIYFINLTLVFRNHSFAKQTIETYTNYSSPIFTIEKIIFFSNAFVIDNSKNQNLQDIDIGQYTDIAIYINNKNSSEELTDENTVKELYIDNIKITSNSDKGEKMLGYKNPSYFAKYKGLEVPENNRIDFNIISTNKDNKESAYGSPAFYQDCSNPISLGYINKDLATGLSVDSGSSVSLDGKILSLANVTLKDLVFTMSFDIHIINNKNEEFVCYINKPILSEEENNSIFNGYIATQFSPSPGTYQFIRKE